MVRVIRGIIFDCFGVLVHGSLGYLRDLTPPHHRRELDELSQNSDYGYISHDEYVTRVGQLIGCSGAEIAAITSAQRVRNERLIDLVRSLRPAYKVGLLSNVGETILDKLFSVDEAKELFDTVVLSHKVGMVKPHPAIYKLTAARLGVEPSECVMIDDIAANVRGAEAVGMHGIVCSSTDQLETDLNEALQQYGA